MPYGVKNVFVRKTASGQAAKRRTRLVYCKLKVFVMKTAICWRLLVLVGQ